MKTRLPNYVLVATTKNRRKTVYRYCYTKQQMARERRVLAERYHTVKVYSAKWQPFTR